MSYVISVGGDPVNPNPFTYSQIEMTESVILVWPSNNQDATYTATNWIDITASVGSLSVELPPADEAATGAEVVFNNYGAQTIIINDSTGGNITTVTAGTAIRVWITDNSTAAGTWRVANIGSGTTAAVASMLAGYGLIAQAGVLSQSMMNLSYSTDITLNAGHRAAMAKWTGGAGIFTLDTPATLGNGWFTDVHNAGTGILTINGNGATIDTNASTTVAIGQGFTIETDGVSFYTSGKSPPTTTNYTFLTKSVAGAIDVTLTSSEAAYSIIYFTGVLTGNINVIVPTAVNEWVMFNNTSGAFSLTVKTAAGTGVAISQATRRILNCDGTNVNYSDSVGTGTVTSISTGTGLTGGPITGSGTISLANTAVAAGTYGSLSKVVSYSVNAQGQITSTTDYPINVSSVIGTLPVSNGGTGSTSLTANSVILGNGTIGVQFVAPGTSGNVLTSNGTTWTSSASSGAMKTVKIQKFTSDGTYTPSTGMLYCIIELVGGGGGGGGAASGADLGQGGGGGYGGYGRSVLSAATIGVSQAVTIGAAGTAGAYTGGDGGTGGTTSVGSFISATGGIGGKGCTTTNVPAAGGLGGATITADIAIPGAPGGASVAGGGAQNCTGQGGSGIFGGGGVAIAGQSAAPNSGNAGVGFGSGGSGGISHSGTGATGGAGKAGFVVVTEYCSQ